jgi:hypothetical protein
MNLYSGSFADSTFTNKNWTSIEKMLIIVNSYCLENICFWPIYYIMLKPYFNDAYFINFTGNFGGFSFSKWLFSNFSKPQYQYQNHSQNQYLKSKIFSFGACLVAMHATYFILVCKESEKEESGKKFKKKRIRVNSKIQESCW